MTQSAPTEGKNAASRSLLNLRELSETLRLKQDEVEAQLASQEGRGGLVDQLVKNKKFMKERPGLTPNQLQQQIDLAGSTLGQKTRTMEQFKSPEKKGLLRRLGGWMLKHPIKSALIIAALAAGGYIAWRYFGHMVMAWMHGQGEQAAAQVIHGAVDAPGAIPAAPSAPNGMLDFRNLPLGKG